MSDDAVCVPITRSILSPLTNDGNETYEPIQYLIPLLAFTVGVYAVLFPSLIFLNILVIIYKLVPTSLW